jgi:hypothetical protein
MTSILEIRPTWSGTLLVDIFMLSFIKHVRNYIKLTNNSDRDPMLTHFPFLANVYEAQRFVDCIIVNY